MTESYRLLVWEGSEFLQGGPTRENQHPARGSIEGQITGLTPSVEVEGGPRSVCGVVAAVQRKVSLWWVTVGGWWERQHLSPCRLRLPRIVTPGCVQEILAVPDQW